MGNYKPQILNIVSVGGHTRFLAPDIKIKILYGNHNLGGLPLSAFDTTNATVYKVPTGKKLIIIGISVVHSAVTQACTIYSGPTVNSIASASARFAFMPNAQIDSQEWPAFAEFAEDQYITADPIGLNIWTIYYVGYEENV